MLEPSTPRNSSDLAELVESSATARAVMHEANHDLISSSLVALNGPRFGPRFGRSPEVRAVLERARPVESHAVTVEPATPEKEKGTGSDSSQTPSSLWYGVMVGMGVAAVAMVQS